tara:strand:- start:931 stop:1095 length:165 start_codon:yes stop_codon:yes gene_type:complete
MEEIIVEGLDYEDFQALLNILKNNTNFKSSDKEFFASSIVLIDKIEKILDVFEE